MLGLGAWILVGYVSVAGVEEPKYTVAESKGTYEIREYPAQLAAEVTVKAEYKEALNGGFRKLADFIFGNNAAPTATADTSKSEKIAMTAPVLEREAKSEKIAMTAPVLERNAKDSAHVVSFMMPDTYTAATLPKPKNAEVKIIELPKRRYAVLRFSGTATSEKAQEMKRKLVELVARDGFDMAGEPILAQYNPPWTPPFMRRNEVWLEVK